MRITKLGHCCLVIDVSTKLNTGETGVRIMTDPGAYSTLQNDARNIDYIFITHEHQDHFHLESLKTVLKNNPEAKIVTNRGVGKLLDAEKIAYQLLEHGGAEEFGLNRPREAVGRTSDETSSRGVLGGVHVEGHGEKHATIYQDFGQVQNTGYFFANRFFYPGDAFYNPHKPVEILALPVAGPWLKISDAIDYAKALKPKVAFPVHDGMLKFLGPTRGVTERYLSAAGIEFRDAVEGTELSF